MKRNIILAVSTGIVVLVLLVAKYGDMGAAREDDRVALGKPGPRHLRERGHRDRLVTDAKGNLIGLSAFEANLRLDDTFVKDTKGYRDRLLVNYIELGLRSNPTQTLRFLRESHAEWAGDISTAAPIIRAVASTLGIEASREFLDLVPDRKALATIVTGISLDLKDGDSSAMVDFFLGYDSSLLADEAVMGNLMKKAGGNISLLTEFYRKLPQCPERVAAAAVLAQKAAALGIGEFGKFYHSISADLTQGEMGAMHSKLAESMDSLSDPKLALLLENGYKGDQALLLAIAASSADNSLDAALDSLRSLNANEKDRDALFCGVMRSWAQYAPKKAAQYAYSSYQSGEATQYAMNVVYGEWIARDTSTAVDYFNRLDLDMETKRLIDLSHFPNVASYSIGDGLAMLQERQDDPDYLPGLVDNMRRDFALTDGAHHSPQVVLGELAKIQDPTLKDSTYFRFSSALASEDLFKAVSLAAQTTIPSQRDQMLLGALAPAVSYDISYAHQMIGNISDPRKRDDAYLQWYDIARNTEPNIAAEWVGDLKNVNPQLYDKIYK